ncbi:MAG: hypothetical protein EXS59_02460 [Candidatus Taylorbacteria bacterium]|nr:hypothetical protein [Candidatus Taylorbacteria bacterium]
MLYLIHGTDREKILAKSNELVAGLKKRKPDAEVFRISDSQSLSRLEELVGGQGLFESKYIVVVKNVLADKNNTDKYCDLLPALSDSANVFIFVDGKINKPIVDAFKSAKGQLQEFVIAKEDFSHADSRPNFNIFALADALGSRDRKGLWVLYQKAIKRDIAPEEISGTLFWQVKSIMLAEQTASASEAGISPFVFQKAKRYSRNFPSGEIKNIALSLVKLYHDSHRGLTDFETGLERLILSV